MKKIYILLILSFMFFSCDPFANTVYLLKHESTDIGKLEIGSDLKVTFSLIGATKRVSDNPIKEGKLDDLKWGGDVLFTGTLKEKGEMDITQRLSNGTTRPLKAKKL